MADDQDITFFELHSERIKKLMEFLTVEDSLQLAAGSFKNPEALFSRGY